MKNKDLILTNTEIKNKYLEKIQNLFDKNDNLVANKLLDCFISLVLLYRDQLILNNNLKIKENKLNLIESELIITTYNNYCKSLESNNKEKIENDWEKFWSVLSISLGSIIHNFHNDEIERDLKEHEINIQ